MTAADAHPDQTTEQGERRGDHQACVLESRGEKASLFTAYCETCGWTGADSARSGRPVEEARRHIEGRPMPDRDPKLPTAAPPDTPVQPGWYQPDPGARASRPSVPVQRAAPTRRS